MKTIAVLTDFSERSEHAAKYALHLAQKIKANVLLYNSFLVPADIPTAAAQVAWPVNEYDEIKSDTEKSLTKLCNKLKHEVKSKTMPEIFVPEITCRYQEGIVANTLPSLEGDKNIVLLVAGTHGSDAISTFILGNNCLELIDDTKFPLLLVPENAPIEDIKKIVFATDLDTSDVKYINALAGLAHKFHANILVANVSPETSPDAKHNKTENSFMQQMVLKVNYRRLSYHNIPDQNVKKGLTWVLENEKPDLLVMVHRKSGSLFDFFFKSSITKKIATNINTPLLVYPYPEVILN